MNELLRAFCMRFEERFGRPYLANFGKDGKLMKSVMAVCPTDYEALLERFFNDDDDWLKEVGYTVPVFYSRINKYLSTSGGGSAYGQLRGPVPRGDAKVSVEHGDKTPELSPKGRVQNALGTNVRETQVLNRGQVSSSQMLRLSSAVGNEDAARGPLEKSPLLDTGGTAPHPQARSLKGID